MSEASPNRDLFRIYAAGCLIGTAFVVAVAYQLADAPDAAVTIYLAIGVVLWAIDMAVTGLSGHAVSGGHGLAHAVLIAGFALVWPLAVAAALAALGVIAFKALRG